ncbi:hypothetical protein KFU94_20135 [Chloroflexi bacterium TSY]|nr:hypothetical protein [Chloroflexi bacterium TSY]
MMDSFAYPASMNFATEAHFPSESFVFQATAERAEYRSQMLAGDRFDVDAGGLRFSKSFGDFYVLLVTLLSGKGLSDKGQTERGGKKNPP